MGGGRWDTSKYYSDTATRRATKRDDFEYSKTSTRIHPDLNPMRIKDKPYRVLESRDSAEHPESNAVVLALDVTGSNYSRAREAQAKLPNLMAMLEKYLPDPQVAVAANDDILAVGGNAIQMSEFESDNRIDEDIRKMLLVGQGGANDGESYDLLMYGVLNKTAMDCFEKRNRKGYFFMYADEPIFEETEASDVRTIFGDPLQANIPIKKTIADLKNKFHVFVLWPLGGYDHARKQYVELFGKECVVTLQQPGLICEMVGSLIGMQEGKIKSYSAAEADLKASGAGDADINLVIDSLKAQRRIAADASD